MSDTGECGDIKETFRDDETKVNIELTFVNLDCVKNEPKELVFEEDSSIERYRLASDYRNIFGEPSHHTNIEDYNNLIGFRNNYVIKEEDDGSFNNFHCRKCKGIYKGFCLKCSTLLHILNNNLPFVKSKSNMIPTDILEIRETATGKGVYLLRTLPINVIFGPFVGILGIESTVGHSWKIIDNKLRNIKSGNWMKNIACASNASMKNLDVFQIDGNLYFETNREITEGDELLIYYDDDELQHLDNSEECLYTPRKQEKLVKIFACTMCCLGFGSNECLIEHKTKCSRMEYIKSMKDFVLVECHYCKMWMEKWEHEEHHVAYCLDKHQRMGRDYSEAVDGTDIADGGTKDGKRTYRGGDICSRPKDRKDDLELDTKDFHSFGGNHEARLNESALAECSNNEQMQNAIETDNESHFQKYVIEHIDIKPFSNDIYMPTFTPKDSPKKQIKNKHTSSKNYKCLECSFTTNSKTNLQKHVNKHRGIKPFTCDICEIKFTQKSDLTRHIKNKHEDGVKDYKCLECSYQTNHKTNFQNHLNKHKGIKRFECAICMMKFSEKGSLNTHIKFKHTDDGNAKDYKCLECTFQTNYKTGLQNHILKHTGIKSFKCDICMMTFTLKGHLVTHIKNKHTDDGSTKDYRCLECSYQINSKSLFQNHLNKHKGIKAFQCDICMQKFTQNRSLKVHIRNKHTDDANGKDYKCSECPYLTNDKRNFQAHLNKHKGIKPFTCDICMMQFTEKSSRTRHIKNMHTDDGNGKDYKCLECSYQSNSKTNFQMHQNKHRGIKAFKCDICVMKFTQKSDLARHVKIQHEDFGGVKEYKCLECSFQTSYKCSLQMHVNKHRGIKPFKCDICAMKFTCNKNLARHMKSQHVA